ncbi:MAG: M23 family metallopeptidase [Alistipes sp.]|nr:M23 family metallopeptidase [Alistipes sp.]MBQ2037790.1 M23 family metallopeptidase [Alistipes sp.]MBQ5715939.1 M23 family metallopeptidase [Alistipes sp.]
MSDPILREEEWAVHLSPMGLLGAVGAFLLLIFALVLVLVAYTPVLDIFPGYRTAAEKQHDDLVQNMMRIDSLERRMSDMLTYNENIAMILEGRSPVVRTPLNDGDTTSLDKTLVPPSQFDSLLRAEMEGDGDYSLARTLRSREQGDGKLFFAAPVEGIITRHFSRDDNYLGVGIQAAPNAPVTSIDDGTVIDVVTGGERGTLVTVQHFNGFVSIYRNLSQVLVSKGQVLKSRQVIGYNAMADAGKKDNPLVEMEIWSEGKAVDPENYIVF